MFTQLVWEFLVEVKYLLFVVCFLIIILVYSTHSAVLFSFKNIFHSSLFGGLSFQIYFLINAVIWVTPLLPFHFCSSVIYNLYGFNQICLIVYLTLLKMISSRVFTTFLQILKHLWEFFSQITSLFVQVSDGILLSTSKKKKKKKE